MLMSGEVIDEAFRERLMLAVTEVNDCRYCSFAHARRAIKAGLTRDDVETLLVGDLGGCPPDQAPAVLYAQHWAEADAQPDPDVRQRVVDIYGEARTEYIELALRMIRVGNLTGNAWDYTLYRISGGRWGNTAVVTS